MDKQEDKPINPKQPKIHFGNVEKLTIELLFQLNETLLELKKVLEERKK